ncbi:MAG: hypothetical protein AUH05_14930 [Ktedonobacter sp. 13_2_20CM_53_11]|nr:MAG: hypothetical protein AUH05_14930 [Ktedonobacter sp. 13_2_20CM_53_11]
MRKVILAATWVVWLHVLIRFLADERCDSMKSMYMSSSETRIELYQRRVFLFDSTRPILPHTYQRGGV